MDTGRQGRNVLSGLVGSHRAVADFMHGASALRGGASSREVTPSATLTDLLTRCRVQANGTVRDVLALITRAAKRGKIPLVILVPDGLGLHRRLSAVAERPG